jgi:hypothetical protein
MSVVIRFSATEELKALPILLRHSPGTILRDRTYILSPEAIQTLREEGIRFTTLGSESNPPRLEGVPAGERV